MKKSEKGLLQIGEVTKSLGITRRILINYEDLGLVTPTYKNEGQGFRFYSADNIVHIKLIRVLQNLGLSLSEIRGYFNDSMKLGEQIDRLVILRNELDRYISQLRQRQASGTNFEILQVTLPAFTAYCVEFHNADIKKKTVELRQTYIDAVKNFKIDMENRICTQTSLNDYKNGRFIIPIINDNNEKNVTYFPQAEAICIYFRGAYEDFPKVYKKLLDYAEEHNFTPNGYFRNIYMEGPPTHGTNKNAYITQISLPIKFVNIPEDIQNI